MKANIQVTTGSLTFHPGFWSLTNSMDIPGCQLQARGLTGNSEALGNRGISGEKTNKPVWATFFLCMTGYGMFVSLVFGWQVRECRLLA